MCVVVCVGQAENQLVPSFSSPAHYKRLFVPSLSAPSVYSPSLSSSGLSYLSPSLSVFNSFSLPCFSSCLHLSCRFCHFTFPLPPQPFFTLAFPSSPHQEPPLFPPSSCPPLPSRHLLLPQPPPPLRRLQQPPPRRRILADPNRLPPPLSRHRRQSRHPLQLRWPPRASPWRAPTIQRRRPASWPRRGGRPASRGRGRSRRNSSRMRERGQCSKYTHCSRNTWRERERRRERDKQKR